jgi:hypothetical protein
MSPKMLSVAGVIFLCGCATIKAPEKTANINVSKPLLETAKLLDQKAHECIEKEVDPLRNGVSITSRVNSNKFYVINIYRVTWSHGISPTPFSTIELMGNSNNETLVIISEGDFNCGNIGAECSKIGITPRVQKWLKGDLAC